MERPHTKQTTRGDAPGKSRWMTDGPLSQRAPESSEIHFQAPDTESIASLSQNRLMFQSLEARGRADCGSDCAHPLLRRLCRLVAFAQTPSWVPALRSWVVFQNGSILEGPRTLFLTRKRTGSSIKEMRIERLDGAQHNPTGRPLDGEGKESRESNSVQASRPAVAGVHRRLHPNKAPIVSQISRTARAQPRRATGKSCRSASGKRHPLGRR